MKGDLLIIVVVFDANGEARGSYYVDDGKSYEYEVLKSLVFVCCLLFFKNGYFVVLVVFDVDGGVGNVKFFVDEMFIERVSVYGSFVAVKSATCSTIGDMFDVVVWYGEVMDIRCLNFFIF